MAARQVAGLALPTRSVHRLPRVSPRREAPERPLGRAEAARSAFSFTTTFLLVTLAAAGLGWIAGQPRFVLQLPEGTVGRLQSVSTVSAVASVATLLIGLLAAAIWCVRALAHRRRHRRLA